MSRDLLHKNKVIDFKKWLELNDWISQECKGDYEVLRMLKEDEDILIVHKKAGVKEHVTIHGESEKWFWMWKKSQRELKKEACRCDEYSKDELIKEVIRLRDRNKKLRKRITEATK